MDAKTAPQGVNIAREFTPFIRAMLITLAGWRFIFLINVPIGIVNGIAAHFACRGSRTFLGSAQSKSAGADRRKELRKLMPS